MGLSSRELYLVIRAKNEATAQLNSLARDMDKARASADMMGLQMRKAHLQEEQSLQRAAKAQAEYTMRQTESQKAAAQQVVAQEQSRQATLGYANSMLTAQQATQQQQKAVLEHRQALDQNAVSLLQNAKAQNTLQIERLRGVAGSDDQIRSIRANNQEIQQNIINTRNAIVARQDEINGVRNHINATKEQINAGNELQQNYRSQLLNAQNSVKSYDSQINAQREVISGMRNEIAGRQSQIDSVNREISDTRLANAARAEAAQRMRDTGQAMMGAGTAIAVGGGVALTGMWKLTQAAVDYERQTAYTMTQTKGLGTNLKELGGIGLDVAKNFGVPFDQIQKSLFDIFSSMDVSVPQAKTLLNDFAKAAVAGQTDIEKAGAATIGIMNAYHVPISQATHVLDEQFQTVKLGRIEYDQLAGTIGRTIPSAQRAGQSFSVLGGMIALMTRNGATAANAVTAAGRAMDLFAKPTVGQELKKIGVATTDAAGRFLPLTKVIPQLQKALEDLNPADRAAKLDAMFKGSGNNIQARRFVDLVVNSKQASDAFVSFSNQIEHSTGATNSAYGTMADTMAVKSEKIKNQWQVLKIELGTSLFPILTQLMGALKGVIGWFESLSDSQKKWLAIGTVIGATLAVVIGVVVALAGAFMVLAAAVTAATWPVILIVAAVAAVIAALVLAYNKVGWFHDGVNAYFQGVATVAKTLWSLLVAVWNGIVECIQGSWTDIKAIWDALTTGTHNVGQFFTDLYRNWIKPAIDNIVEAAMWLWHNGIEPSWNGIKQAISTAWDIIQGIWTGIKAAINLLGQAFMSLYTTFVKPYWDLIKLEIDIAWAAIQVVWGLIQIAIKVLGQYFTDLYENKIKPAWDNITRWISQAWDAISAKWNEMIAYIKGKFADAWDWISQKISAIWTAIQNKCKEVWDWIRTNILQGYIDFFNRTLEPAWEDLKNKISAVWDSVQNKLSSVWNWVKVNVFDNLAYAVTKTIPDAFNTCVRAVESAWDKVKQVVAAPIHWVLESALNNGILKGYNALASSFHVSPNNVQVAVPFATGGPVWGPGGPKSDMIPAMLSNGEHVWTAAEVRAAGGQAAVAKLRALALNRNVDKYAAGGPVIGKLAGVGSDITMMKGQQGGPLDWLGDIASAVLDPIGSLSKLAGLFGSIPDAGHMSSMLVGAGKNVLDGIINWVKDKFIPAAPAGAGPLLAGPQGNSVGRILQWGRMFYSGAMVSSGYRPGANDYHGMGLAADLIGGGASGMNQIAAGFYGIGGRLLELIHNGGPGYAIKNGARVDGPSFYRSVWADHANHVHVAATNEALMDSGGLLRPGMTMVRNNTGGAERVLSMAQTQSFDRLVAILGGSQGGGMGSSGLAPVGGYGGSGQRPVTINVYTNEIDPRRHAMMLGMELDKQIG